MKISKVFDENVHVSVCGYRWPSKLCLPPICKTRPHFPHKQTGPDLFWTSFLISDIFHLILFHTFLFLWLKFPWLLVVLTLFSDTTLWILKRYLQTKQRFGNCKKINQEHPWSCNISNKILTNINSEYPYDCALKRFDFSTIFPISLSAVSQYVVLENGSTDCRTK